MKKVILLAILLLMSCNKEIKNGDIIFHTSSSSQSKALQIVTESKYTHMGIIYRQNGRLYVYEAVGPVKSTPFGEWIDRGENDKYVVKRLKNRDKVLTPEVLQKMKQVGENFRGKSYDLKFEWSNKKMYCSELVWKIFNEGADIEIGKLQNFSSFDLSAPEVQKIISKRWGGESPLTETVITPVSMFNDERLITIKGVK